MFQGLQQARSSGGAAVHVGRSRPRGGAVQVVTIAVQEPRGRLPPSGAVVSTRGDHLRGGLCFDGAG